MLKFPSITKQDLKEAAIIEKKRQYENDRKLRIFNSRFRTIGVDEEGLSAQIQEKKRLQEAEDEERRQYEKQMAQHTELIRQQEIEEERQRRKLMADDNLYRELYQKKESGREFDISDPKLQEKTPPTRLGDFDPRLGVSSAQTFVGEDLMHVERTKAQKEQQRLWLIEQMKDRQRSEQQTREAERQILAAVNARERLAHDIDEQRRNFQRQLDTETARFNLNLAAKQEVRRRTDRTEEELDNKAEIFNNITSDMLTENLEGNQSTFGPHRKVAQDYRGMTQAEREAFKKEQMQQIEENRKKREEQLRVERNWEQIVSNFSRSLFLSEREAENRQKATRKTIAEMNIALADEQRARNEYMNKVAYKNEATKAYFEQFNTTTR